MHTMILILLMCGSGAWAEYTSIEVKTEWLVNGKSIGKPMIRLLSGEPGQISQGGDDGNLMRMKVMAKPTSETMEEIFLDMDFEYKYGERYIRSKPQVIAKAGSEAVMTLEESTKSEKLQLKVTAKPMVR